MLNWSYGFLPFQLFGHFFGHLVFYLLGPLALVYSTSSIFRSDFLIVLALAQQDPKTGLPKVRFLDPHCIPNF